ncbi:uncharacterized protein [Hyperolius riggenbachi]|uniref:uncharacterized protein isoform X2 n=1 Tax=Hyperolius riggenbachi TaxID=752182 RepID=UPI0035A39FC8
MDDFSIMGAHQMPLDKIKQPERQTEDEQYSDFMDLPACSWGQTGLNVDPKYRIGGSVESILSQTSVQSPQWTPVKSARSQDTLVSPSHYIPDQMWPNKQNKSEGPEIVDDVVGDEIIFTFKQFQKEVTGDKTAQILTASLSLPHRGIEATRMSDVSSAEDIKTEREIQNHLQGTSIPWTKAIEHSLDGSAETERNNYQAADCNGSPNISVSLLKEILMEREAKIDELRKEIRRVQSENVHIVEEKQQLLLENEHLRTQAETTIIKKERNGQNFMDSFDPNSPVVLQRQIRNLKSQISDLQEANESAVMELTKADEEISQQRKDLAMLKAEYSQKLHDSQEQINILMEQMNLPSSGLIQPDNYQEEVIQLRGECRRLRMQGHQLSEENYRLKEDLWDLRMQKEGLLSKTKDELHYSWTPKSEWSSSGDKNLQCGSWCSEQNRREMFNGVFPKHKAVSGPEVLKEPWERKHEALYRRSASPYSADSENTEVLVLGYHEDELHKPYHTYTNGSEHEEILELRKEDLCTVSPIKENIISNSEQNGINSLIYGSSRKSPTCMRKQVSVLPRRPFAPKSIADLKHGDLVKFIRPGGKISKGTIQYKGHLPGREEAYLGIELEGGEFGKHDGVFQGTRYFLCKVIMAWS